MSVFLSSSDHRFNFCNLSSYDLPFIPFIIFVNLPVSCVKLPVCDKHEGASWRLEQDDVAVAALRGLRAVSQHAGRLHVQCVVARLLSWILSHVPRWRHLPSCRTTGKCLMLLWRNAAVSRLWLMVTVCVLWILVLFIVCSGFRSIISDNMKACSHCLNWTDLVFSILTTSSLQFGSVVAMWLHL